jgi:hypothetical protein
MTTPALAEVQSFSGGGDGNTCVELAIHPDALHLRESDTPSIALVTTPTPLSHLLHGIRSGALGRP